MTVVKEGLTKSLFLLTPKQNSLIHAGLKELEHMADDGDAVMSEFNEDIKELLRVFRDKR